MKEKLKELHNKIMTDIIDFSNEHKNVHITKLTIDADYTSIEICNLDSLKQDTYWFSNLEYKIKE